MIYLLQLRDYPAKIRNILQQALEGKRVRFQTVSEIPRPTDESHTYFIINDVENETWSGMDCARAVRKQDRTGHLILISNDLDYHMLFRSHLSFLAAFTVKEAQSAIREYLDELLSDENISEKRKSG